MHPHASYRTHFSLQSMSKILGYGGSTSRDARTLLIRPFTRCFITVLNIPNSTKCQHSTRSTDLSHPRRELTQNFQRSNEKFCWKCGSAIAQGCTLFCGSPSCGAIQELKEEECNYFKLFGMEESFSLDSGQLEVEFKNLQRQLHPDKFAMSSLEERERSTSNSSFVNQAFQVILCIVNFFSHTSDEGIIVLEPEILFSRLLHGLTKTVARNFDCDF